MKDNSSKQADIYVKYRPTYPQELFDFIFSHIKNYDAAWGSYYTRKNKWRQIDTDWLNQAEQLALWLDGFTNNSSLVLAFELVEQEKVLLFVADAQIGNWKSWLDLSFNGSSVDAKDLLTRTVFYKAGHHSSHNATLAEGLDLMNEKELVIMIPINEEVSTKMNFAMLQQGMLKGYNRKSEGRVLRADTIFHKPKSASAFKFPFASSEKDFSPKVKIVKDKSKESHLYIEYVVK